MQNKLRDLSQTCFRLKRENVFVIKRIASSKDFNDVRKINFNAKTTHYDFKSVKRILLDLEWTFFKMRRAFLFSNLI